MIFDKKKISMVKPSGRRSEEKWQVNMEIAIDCFKIIESKKDPRIIKEYCTAFRNPIIFDNQCVESSHELDYYLPSDDKTTKDHLIGMSNIVLYMSKNKIYQKWKTIEDFKESLRALQALMEIPKCLNDTKVFKVQYEYENINECIKWNTKFKNEGIDKVISKETNSLISIDDVWSEWYTQYKKHI